MTPPDNRKKPWTENLPFPRHWLSYIILKFAVLIAGVVLVLYLTWLVA